MEQNQLANQVVDSGSNIIKRKAYPQEFKDQVVGVYRSVVYESVDDCAAAYDTSGERNSKKGRHIFCHSSTVKYMFIKDNSA
ncbi:MAG: hypothetical protein QG673_1757 [Pseudomonadota bacterium]|nr:hypothetical protein [Pseudomonadota bacterium]